MDPEYINGSDLLIEIDGGAIGHCSSHTTTMGTETKTRAVKPKASASASAGVWNNKGVTGKSIAISAEGLRSYEEDEKGFEEIAALWGAGDRVKVKAFRRSKDTTPYIEGYFIITQIEETAPAQDDATYSIQLENDGEPDIYPGKETAAES